MKEVKALKNANEKMEEKCYSESSINQTNTSEECELFAIREMSFIHRFRKAQKIRAENVLKNQIK